MKLNEKDVNMFKQLHESDNGKQLVNYLQRLVGEVCDSRTWADGEDKVHANKTAKVLQENLIDKVVLRSEASVPSLYPYE